MEARESPEPAISIQAQPHRACSPASDRQLVLETRPSGGRQLKRSGRAKKLVSPQVPLTLVTDVWAPQRHTLVRAQTLVRAVSFNHITAG
jgi:hypothetical protein